MILIFYMHKLTNVHFQFSSFTFLVGVLSLSSGYVLIMFLWNNLASQATVLKAAGMFVRENNKSSLAGAMFPMKKLPMKLLITNKQIQLSA